MIVNLLKAVRIDGTHFPAGEADVPNNAINGLLASAAIERRHEAALPTPAQAQSFSALPTNGSASLAVAVTCHKAYIGIVDNQLNAIDKQTVAPTEKFLILDGCVHEPRAGWTIIAGKFNGPNKGRNAASERSSCTWMIFADADDVMHPQYCAAIAGKISKVNAKCAIIYSDLLRSGKLERMPAGADQHSQTIRNRVSSCAAWRLHAIRESGGWPVPNDRYDDWTLANRILARLWTAVHQGDVPICCDPPENAALPHRSKTPPKINKWKHRTYTIVTLLAGRRKCFTPWYNWLKKTAKPDHCKLLVVDNSHDEKYHAMVRQKLSLLPGFESIEVRRCDLKYEDAKNAWGEWGMRHVHVSRIYTEILPAVVSDFILFLEDDTIPPANAFRDIVDRMDLRSNPVIAAISGVYSSRVGGDRITAAPPGNYWTKPYSWSDLPSDGKLMPVGFLAGGFSLWRGGVVRATLPLTWDRFGIYLRGWDARISLQARLAGYSLFIDPKIKCKHMTGEDEHGSENDKSG